MKLIGTITKTKGFRGHFSVSGIPAGLIPPSPSTLVNIGYSASFTEPYIIKECKLENNNLIVLLEDVDSDKEAEKLLNKGCFIAKEELFYEANKFSPGDITGCNVYDIITGDFLGEISEIIFTSANDVWVIEDDTGRLPVPVIEQVIKSVDLKNRRIEIELIPGLKELRQ